MKLMVPWIVPPSLEKDMVPLYFPKGDLTKIS